MSDNYEAIKHKLGPCGINCEKCFANSHGDIKKKAIELKELLGNFDIYAKRFSRFLPEFKKYHSFKEMLQYFTEGDCNGCRNGTCKYPDCGIIKCYKEKGVDFCFQCEEFPCEKTNFDPDLKRRWILMNNRAKEIGIDAYYKESMKYPRYRSKV